MVDLSFSLLAAIVGTVLPVIVNHLGALPLHIGFLHFALAEL
jgi:riboflavin transporter FmnP